jgi:CheY-like chemotaxis protein
MTLKILIADDSPTIQKIVTLAFGCEDATVECASDGEAALDAIQAHNPDIVLADIVMPGYSGYEICRRIKENASLAHIPVVLLSGTFEAFDEEEAARLRCDGHLIKPFDTNELIETVHTLAENRKAPQNSNTSVETPGMDMQTNAASSPESHEITGKIALHPQVWDSYLGSGRILDLFDLETIRQAESISARRGRSKARSDAVGSLDSRTPTSSYGELSDDALNLIVDRVIKRMSADVIREVAWEVVPELSENIIRRTLEEHDKG